MSYRCVSCFYSFFPFYCIPLGSFFIITVILSQILIFTTFYIRTFLPVIEVHLNLCICSLICEPVFIYLNRRSVILLVREYSFEFRFSTILKWSNPGIMLNSTFTPCSCNFCKKITLKKSVPGIILLLKLLTYSMA